MACVIIEKVRFGYDETQLKDILDSDMEMEGTVLSIILDSSTEEATIYFSLFSDAEKLITKGYVKYGFLEMPVKKPLNCHSEGVIILGNFEKDEKDFLMMYFSNQRTSGGGKILNVEYFEPQRCFIVILYEEANDAKGVIEKHLHIVGEATYTAWQWIPGGERRLRMNAKVRPQLNQSHKADYQVQNKIIQNEDTSDEDEDNFIILAKGFPSKTKQDTIKRFFQSKRQSGGGPVQKVTAREDGSFIIAFREQSSLDGVLEQRDRLSYDDNPIKVIELSTAKPKKVDGPTEEKMVYVKGDLAKLSKKSLILFIEDISGIDVEDIEYESEGTALVIFKDAFDYETLNNEAMRQTCEDEILRFQKVKHSSIQQKMDTLSLGIMEDEDDIATPEKRDPPSKYTSLSSFGRQHSTELLNAHAGIMNSKSGNKTSKKDEDTSASTTFKKSVQVPRSSAPKIVAGLSSGNSSLPTLPKSSEDRKKVFPLSRSVSIKKNDVQSSVAKEEVKIIIMEGLIAKQKTQAIVNSVPISLNLSVGALSKSIMNELHGQYKRLVQLEAYKYQGKNYGEVFSTEAGNLECQEIFHIILPSWKEDPADIKILEGAMDKILFDCNVNGLTSLAIPAIGTGNLGWPAEVVAESFFNSVTRFSRKRIERSLETIYFVIYPGDSDCLQEFNRQLLSFELKGGRCASTGREEMKVAYSRQEQGMASGGDPEHVGATHLPASVAELQIGNVKLQLTTGDITQETTDGIVNNTNSNLDLSLGSVSRALVFAGGPSFEAECRKLGSIRPNTAAVTGSGNMLCKYVIHVDVASSPIKWIAVIKRCLQTAEGNRMRSLTFPALGTGAYAGDPAEMAMNLIDAVTDFALSDPTHLTLIRVVVYESELFKVYFSKMG